MPLKETPRPPLSGPSIPWIDAAKGLGILLVILGHAGVPSWTKALIFTFHMPLFFFLSGYLFNAGKYLADPLLLLTTKGARLILPYVVSFTALTLAWQVIRLVVVTYSIPYESPVFSLTLPDSLISLLYGNGAALVPSLEKYALLVDPPLWFLPTLFCSVLLLSLCLRVRLRAGTVPAVLVAGGCLIAGLLIGSECFLPWGLDIAGIALIFSGAGLIYRQTGPGLHIRLRLLIIPALTLLVLAAFLGNGPVDMNTRQYENPFWFVAGGLAGSLMVCELAAVFSLIPAVNRVLSIPGKISMFILVFHVPLMVFCIGPLRIISPGIYDLIQASWMIWFTLSLGLCLLGWEAVRRVPALKKVYSGG